MAIVEYRLHGIPIPGIGTDLFMPILYPSPRKKFKLLHPVEKVRSSLLPMLCAIPMTYKKAINRRRRCIKVRG